MITPFHTYLFSFLKMKLSFLFLAFCLLTSIFCFSQPSISGFNPASGPIGTSVTISGNNFSSTPVDNIVFIGGVKAAVTSASPTSITINVPFGAINGLISVNNANLTAFALKPFSITYSGAPSTFSSTSFADDIEVGTGASPVFGAAGDLDGDGKPDMVVVNFGAATVSVYRNASAPGAISYAPRADFAVRNGPRGVCMGDLDGDGKLDVVVANATTNVVSILRNISTTGSISFATKIDITTGTTPRAVAIVDFDGDGKPDVAVANETSATLSIYRNTSTPGSISFAAKIDFATGTKPYSIATADFDGNGIIDIAVSNNGSNSVSVFRNISSVGNIMMAAKADFATASSPREIKAGDLNGDDKPELVVVNSTSGSFSLLRNTGTSGNISFAGKIDFLTLSGPRGIFIHDLNGDGMSDVSVITFSSAMLSVYKNNSAVVGGVVTLAARTEYNTVLGDSPESLFISDMDGDGKPDIAALNYYYARLSLFRNKINEPVIKSFSPTSAATGAVINITGTNFNNITGVYFGGTSAASYIVLSDTTITATVASGTTGAVSVVSDYGRDSLAGFTYYPEPVITSFIPQQASAGTEITITGNNFTNVTGVSFGGTPASSFAVVSPTIITAMVGSGTSGNVEVETFGGTFSSPGFTIIYAPEITSINPLIAPAGAPVVIKGKHFSSTPNENTVYFGPVKATVLNSTDTSLSVTVPTGATCQPITVITKNLTALSKDNFILSFPVGVPSGKDFLPSSFNSKIVFPTGNLSYPLEAATGDFDGDGKADIVVAGNSKKILSIFKNTSTSGNVSFAPVMDISMGTGNMRGYLTVADIDGDNKLDIITIVGSNVITVFRNISTGGNIDFAPKADFTMSANVYGIAVADFNGDGRLDISAILASNLVAILRNTSSPGSTSFAPATNFASSTSPVNITAADIDGDNKTDIVVLHNSSTTVSILRNISSNGTIGFAPKVDLAILPFPVFVSVGDLDADGKKEIVISSGTTSANSYISIFKNNSTVGNISFASRIDSSAANSPRGLAISDMNGDGKPEISVANHWKSLSIFKNNSSSGTISFETRVDYNTDSVTQGICVVDLDGDGINEIGVTAGNSFTVFKSKFEEPVIYSFTPTTGDAGTTITITGLNFSNVNSVSVGGVSVSSFTILSPTMISAIIGTIGTGAMDVRVTNPYGTYSLGGFYSGISISYFSPYEGPIGTYVTISGEHFSANAADNSVYFGAVKANVIFASPTSITVTVPIGATYAPLTVTTGKLTAQADRPFNVTFAGGGVPFTTSSFTMLPSISTLPKSPFNIVSGDLDGDGITDLVISHTSTNTMSVHRNTTVGGSVSFSAQEYSVGNVAGSSNVRVALGDIDGDGKLDVISSHDNSAKISVFRNTSVPGSITFDPKIEFAYQGVDEIAIADIDGDKRPDIILTGSNSLVSIMRNTSSGGVITFDPPFSYSLSTAGRALCVGDFDGDGKIDIAVAAGNISIFRNTSTLGVAFSISSFASRLDFAVGSDPRNCAVADIDGDGSLDIVTANLGSHTISILRNTSAIGSLTFAPRINIGAASGPFGIKITDLDGDGKPDMSAAKFGSQDISVFRNISTVGNIAFQSKVDFPASGEVIWLAEGDFDSDGKPDLAAANYSGGAITILMNRIGGSPLPVSLVNFSAACAGTRKVVTWTTTSEINFDRFEIEHSIDGTNWIKIGVVKAAGHSNESRNYSFHDSKPGNSFYRLKMIDNDGKSSYSNVVNSRCEINDRPFVVYPQPAKHNLTIDYLASHSGKSEIQIVDMFGRIFIRKNVILNMGENNVQLNISGLATGEYFIRIFENGLVKVQQISIIQ